MSFDEMPARLHVVLARETSKAVIVRRGPSKWARIILWHTDTDTFENGQWLRGRIFAERCALSPDGSLLLYFAMQWHKARGGYRGTWTALSKPPYLTALALWPLGDSWSGGGIFLDNRSVYLHQYPTEPHPDHVPPKQLRVITSEDQLTKRDQRTLERIKEKDWRLVHEPANKEELLVDGRRVKDPPVWHYPHPTNERYTLVQRKYGYRPDYYPNPSLIGYALMDWVNNTEIKLEGVNWAEWDQQGRLAYVRDGQVFAQEPQQVGTFARPLADFNDMKFEEIPPPGWATRW